MIPEEIAAAKAERKRRFDALYGRELIELLLEARGAIPPRWLGMPPDEAFEYIRCRLRCGQAELG